MVEKPQLVIKTSNKYHYLDAFQPYNKTFMNIFNINYIKDYVKNIKNIIFNNLSIQNKLEDIKFQFSKIGK